MPARSVRPGSILEETSGEVREILGNDFDSLTVERVVIGIFFTGVKLNDGSGGLCFTPVKEIPEAVCCPSSARAMPYPGRFVGRSAGEFLRDLPRAPPLKKAVGIAVLNALSESCWKRRPGAGYVRESGLDALDAVPLPEEGYVVVVGALVPIIRRLKARGKPFGILEIDLCTLKPDELPYAVPQDKADAAVRRADMLVITGTTLINNTLEPLLALARPGASIIVVGPTASMLPDAFFRRGVTMLGGDSVTSPDALLDTIAEGGSGYHFFGRSAEKTIIHRSSTRQPK
ncbi:DUF364 domain-containing protein [Methanoculleus sp.]|uniref:DUF364 domain-containing protein n=1 Tax=Methanoculleus sp. TaxID=90427 RepID=UPI0025F48D84|nr:DUF364 domain-containing protein [Methanoculleus sp.]MCK9317967.1 DUF364 domain-containing protein [Methanoculleus sp.]MDD2253983.1 DUF364 domain-containing protein [Methanoculleus sp.]MDD2787688.1 DUF364 domain-containing protein [Methanoculleus sp.]MDD3216475.1 DUF364 domain-containing protein [Methanoculleus sp.]MDD4314438.1 DUF364 domain-containing protein [Methanoculleus sp.]